MELALSLGNRGVESTGICMGVGMKKKGSSPPSKSSASDQDHDHDHDDDRNVNMMIKINQQDHQEMRREKVGSSDPSPSLRLHLQPRSPVPLRTQPPPLRFPWLSDNLSSEPGSSDGPGSRIVDVNRRGGGAAEEAEEQSSPNSGTSSFMEFSLYTSTSNGGKGRRENGESSNHSYGQEGMGVGGGVVERGTTAAATTTSRGSDDDENGSSTRKKLRLSKEQSAFLEESFKEHHTLNPKQKLELAKQLNLRPRQVEVWFQNRRARTKLKQTEVDCEYLKRCCETLTEENRRLQKELQELRALKTSQPFFMHLPATTLTMCPSCERVTPASTSSASATVPTKPATAVDSSGGLSLAKPKPKPMLPFSQAPAQTNQASS